MADKVVKIRRHSPIFVTYVGPTEVKAIKSKNLNLLISCFLFILFEQAKYRTVG